VAAQLAREGAATAATAAAAATPVVAAAAAGGSHWLATANSALPSQSGAAVVRPASDPALMAEVGVDENYMAQLKRQEEDRRQS